MIQRVCSREVSPVASRYSYKYAERVVTNQEGSNRKPIAISIQYRYEPLPRAAITMNLQCRDKLPRVER